MGSRGSWLGTLGAIVVACSIDLEPLDSDAGAVGGVGGAAATGGKSNVDAGTPCRRYCERAVATGCNTDTIAQCNDSCEAGAVYYTRCRAAYDAWTSCGADKGMFVCSEGVAVVTNCQTEILSFSDCTWNFDPLCLTLSPPPSGGGCYVSSPCNPLGGGCENGQVCDWSTVDSYYGLQCWPPEPFIAAVCQPCNNTNGPFCQPGHSCVGAGETVCARYCCSDADCGDAPGSCAPYGDTTLRFCAG